MLNVNFINKLYNKSLPPFRDGRPFLVKTKLYAETLMVWFRTKPAATFPVSLHISFYTVAENIVLSVVGIAFHAFGVAFLFLGVHLHHFGVFTFGKCNLSHERRYIIPAVFSQHLCKFRLRE